MGQLKSQSTRDLERFCSARAPCMSAFYLSAVPLLLIARRVWRRSSLYCIQGTRFCRPPSATPALLDLLDSQLRVWPCSENPLMPWPCLAESTRGAVLQSRYLQTQHSANLRTVLGCGGEGRASAGGSQREPLNLLPRAKSRKIPIQSHVISRKAAARSCQGISLKALARLPKVIHAAPALFLHSALRGFRT